jgi:hypothetical protein
MSPYKLRKVPKKDLYWVVGPDNKHHSKEGLPKERALAQMRALYAQENGKPAPKKLKGGVLNTDQQRVLDPIKADLDRIYSWNDDDQIREMLTNIVRLPDLNEVPEYTTQNEFVTELERNGGNVPMTLEQFFTPARGVYVRNPDGSAHIFLAEFNGDTLIISDSAGSNLGAYGWLIGIVNRWNETQDDWDQIRISTNQTDVQRLGALTCARHIEFQLRLPHFNPDSIKDAYTDILNYMRTKFSGRRFPTNPDELVTILSAAKLRRGAGKKLKGAGQWTDRLDRYIQNSVNSIDNPSTSQLVQLANLRSEAKRTFDELTRRYPYLSPQRAEAKLVAYNNAIRVVNQVLTEQPVRNAAPQNRQAFQERNWDEEDEEEEEEEPVRRPVRRPPPVRRRVQPPLVQLPLQPPQLQRPPPLQPPVPPPLTVINKPYKILNLVDGRLPPVPGGELRRIETPLNSTVFETGIEPNELMVDIDNPPRGPININRTQAFYTAGDIRNVLASNYSTNPRTREPITRIAYYRAIPTEAAENRGLGKKVSLTRKAFIKEHKDLLRILKSDDPKQLKKEYKDQAKELKKVMKGGAQYDIVPALREIRPNLLTNDVPNAVYQQARELVLQLLAAVGYQSNRNPINVNTLLDLIDEYLDFAGAFGGSKEPSKSAKDLAKSLKEDDDDDIDDELTDLLDAMGIEEEPDREGATTNAERMMEKEEPAKPSKPKPKGKKVPAKLSAIVEESEEEEEEEEPKEERKVGEKRRRGGMMRKGSVPPKSSAPSTFDAERRRNEDIARAKARSDEKKRLKLDAAETERTKRLRAKANLDIVVARSKAATNDTTENLAEIQRLLQEYKKGGKKRREKKRSYEGEGLTDFVKGVYRKGKKLVSNILEATKGVRKGYPPSVRSVISKYADWDIVDMSIRRDPINSFLTKIVDTVSFGEYSKATKELGYDKVFHLGLVMSLRKGASTVHLLIEKNEVIRFGLAGPAVKDTELLKIPVTKKITLGQFLEAGEKAKGPSFFLYDAFSNNCQMFIEGLLSASGLLTAAAKKFIVQDTGSIVKKIPSLAQKIIKGVTDISAIANVVTEGGKQPKKRR